MAFGFKHGSKNLIKFIAKPTVTGAYTFDNSSKTPVITGYDSKAMTQSGTASATSSGTYTITFTLNKGYAWSDKSKDAVSRTWSIAKRKITAPTMTNTSYTWASGGSYAPTISYDSTYSTQSGTVSSSNAGSWTVTWALNYPNDTTWADNTTANKTATWSVAKRKITVPTLSNTSHTWDVNKTFSPTVSGYDSTYMTQSGTASATNVGSYTITWALKYSTNTTWSDGATANKSATWAVNKKTLTVPTISSATSFAFIEGTTRSITISNFSGTYETQSGTTSTSALGSYTITWALRYPANTQWAGGTVTNKTATWSVVWSNGTSHYSNDLYNKGWYKANSLQFAVYSGSGSYYVVWNSDNFTIQYTKMKCAETYAGKTFHIMIKHDVYQGTKDLPAGITIRDFKENEWGAVTNTTVQVGATYTEISTPHTSSYTNPKFGLYNANNPNATSLANYFRYAIQRIWIT